MEVEQMDEVSLGPSLDEVWAKVQEILAKKLGKLTYDMFIQQIRLQLIEDERVVIAVANQFHKTWITDKCKTVIRDAFVSVLAQNVQLEIVIDETVQSANDYTPSIASITVAPSRRPAEGATTAGAQPAQNFEEQMRVQATNLNPRYTLDSFIVGSHNRFCHSAAMAVSDRPGQTYNPLFIYGGVGLGKTHIMQAIGHHVMTHNTKMVVRYVTCEKFTNDLINSIRQNNMMEFRKRYRQVDVLLIDDIHFIEGKESTQEEFFHTFNALRESGRQIVLSSDRAPKDIPKLEERLRSRFEWGLIADIQPPDLETRQAILRNKCLTDGMDVPNSVLEYIAASVTTNIRELEGALLRAHAYASLTGQTLNLQVAASVLQIGTPASNKSNLSIENIIGVVAAHYKVDTSDLRSAKRSKDLAVPRHVAMFLAHDMLSMSHSRIGEAFGNRKHSSVIYAIDKVKDEMSESVQLSQTIQQIKRQLCN